MPISKLRPTFTFTEDRLRELQAVVPEAFADGKINWDTLREALGEALEDETKEHFGLFWPGKREARGLAALPSKGTLIPQPGAGVDEDNTHNLFIEGDNLEVLKLLQKSYAGRVKMIYIDPPYNTGNDFVYPDDYSEPLEAYLERTGQVDEAGQLLTTNSRSSGRFHSSWLNMMYPRLLLARQLLKDDGSIFVSIDDNEIHNLRELMNEIFGEENFIATVIWQKKYTRSNDAKWFSDNHDYILVYAKSSENFSMNLQPRSEDQLAAYSNPDNHPKGAWKATPLHAKSGNNSNFVYRFKNGTTWSPPPGTYPRFSKDTMGRLDENNEIWFGSTGKSVPSRKTFLTEAKQGVTPVTIWLYEEVGHTHEANNELKDLDMAGLFDNPKPSRLIKRIIELATNQTDEDIVLDFFAGSGTTAQALIQQNAIDSGNRRFILTQLPEPTEHKKYPVISDITKERIRRVVKKIKSESKGKPKINSIQDVGFTSHSLDRSHFKEWELFTDKDTTQLELRFEKSETPLIENWQPASLLSEILLLQGFPLDSKVRSLPEFKANEVQQVTSEFIGHHLYICLDKKVKAETVAKINLRPEDILVCLDSALSDEAKVKLADQCNLKVI